MRRLLTIGVLVVVGAVLSWIARRPSIMEAEAPRKRRCPSAQTLLILGHLGTLVLLILVIMQTCSLNTHTRILQSDYEARSRPYLAIEEIQVQPQTDGSATATIRVENFGILPPTDLKLTDIKLTTAGKYFMELIPTTPDCFVTEEGVSICAQGIITTTEEVTVVVPVSKIHYPGRPRDVEVTMSEQVYSVIDALGEFRILLPYLSGKKDYAYWADVTREDREWKITDEDDAVSEDGKWNITSETGR